VCAPAKKLKCTCADPCALSRVACICIKRVRACGPWPKFIRAFPLTFSLSTPVSSMSLLQEKLDETLLTHGDAILSATGENQLAYKLKTQPGDLALPVDVVFSSPLRRALKTALIAFPTQKIVVLPDLREFDANAGLCQADLLAFFEKTAPNRKAKADLSKVPDKPWWNTSTVAEAPEAVSLRVQRVLKSIHKTITTRKKAVAIVCHGGVIREMTGTPKPFPKEFGTLRAFPMNFKPYFAKIVEEGTLKVLPATAESATVLLLRHAQSRAQEANALQKKIKKFHPAPHREAEDAKALDKKIRRFNAGAEPLCSV
jgi:broad specificity phosphatase PhoE